jgi:hypothetical protein
MPMHPIVVTITAITTTIANVTGIVIGKRWLTIWELVPAPGLDTVAGLQKMQPILESESASENAMLPERVAMIESKMTGTIGMLVERGREMQTGTEGAITTVQETTAGKEIETGTETETETEMGGRTGMFKAGCKMVSLVEGIQS